jgi:two-component system, NarL family, sensor histidine kinase DesK
MNEDLSHAGGAGELGSAQHGRAERRLRRARLLVLGYVMFMVAFFPGLAVLVLVVPGPFDDGLRWLSWIGLVPSLLLAVLVYRMCRLRMRDRALTNLELGLSVLVLVAIGGVYGFTAITALFIGLWWGALLLVANRRQVIVLSVLLLLTWFAGAIAVTSLAPMAEIVFVLLYGLVCAALFATGNLGFFMLWDIAQEAHAGRDAQARLAVSEERLRFARDMHDLLGHSLSAIAAKSQLAARLVERAPDQAASEMRAVQAAAREALREVRAAVSGYREVDVAAELANVRAVLEAAGVRCTVHTCEVAPSGANRALAAWIVREGGTNVLRHSSATQCEITVRRDGSTCVVEVYNDGPAGPVQEPVYGNGLSGLSERVAAAGGTLSASARIGGGFLLRALLPEAVGADRAAGAHSADIADGGDGAGRRAVRAEDTAG